MSTEPCYSIVRKPKGFESSNEVTLKRRIECDNLDKCQQALSELLQSLLDGEKFPTSLMMSVINRYQMNRFSGDVGNRDKHIKKLLYILWECLPKRGPDGRFLDTVVMVCGAFDKDLKHPNQYVCGTVLRTLSKTREPEVIRELVHSVEKCLEWSHAYQRKNAVLAIARIYKNFPDLIPSAPKLVSEYLTKENDDECKRAALQALLEIDPEEAKPYLHSSNIHDIHCMNASIQLLFVELIQRLFKRNSDEAEDYIAILTGLIKLSSSPSVRYQAASTLMKFSRDPESIKLVAACFIDICAKDSDNNVKLIALDSLTKLRRINGAERVIRNSVMDILFILQSASDVTLQGKILRLTLELLSSLNVGGVVAALRQEIEKNANDQDRSDYRRFLIAASHNIAERFPNAVVEFELVDTLFGLLLSSPSESTSSDLIVLFKMFMTKNPSIQGSIVKKIQDNFNLIRNNQAIHSGLIRLLGEFSLTKDQIEKSYLVIKDSVGELPIVASELRKQTQTSDENPTGDDNATVTSSKSSTNGDVDIVTKGMKRLVTADGSYATQSAISYQTSSNTNDEHPPLRAYYLNNKFETASALSRALQKMTCRYRQSDATRGESGKMIARFMMMITSIKNLGHSSLFDADGNSLSIPSNHNRELVDALKVIPKIWNDSPKELAQRLKDIITNELRSQLVMAVTKADEGERFAGDAFKKKAEMTKFNDPVQISLFKACDKDVDIDSFDDTDSPQVPMPDLFGQIPLTGNLNAIYACCEFDVNQYDIGLKIHLDNRTNSTLENVTLELSARGEGSSNHIDRPDPIVLAPRASACITSNMKAVSAESRRLFGSIVYEDTSKTNADDREQVLMLNDISVNITDYIQPAMKSFDEFRKVWRDCEWENKVTVKTKLTNLKEYLKQLIAATNMRCVTSEKTLDGESAFLSANLYAKSSFGEEALVNVGIDQETPTSNVRGSVKIRSRSQGMALSLGEKITIAQNAATQA